MRRRTYLHLLYLLLAIPLGFMYWFIIGFGITFGLVLSIVLVGLGILLATVFLTRLIARFERGLANRLLRVELAPPAAIDIPEGPLAQVRAYLDDAFTWRGLAFVSMKAWIGLLGLVLLVGLVQAASMASAVLRRPHTVSFGEVNGDPVVWTIETLPEAGLALVIGVGIAVVVLHVSNGIGYVAARMSEALLV
ncbi:MAG: sensor domain-containing protein [Halobacteriota archaeon]